MKKILLSVLLCGIFLLCSCGANNNSAIEYAAPERTAYTVSSSIHTEEFKEDNTKIAMYIYEIPVLSASNDDKKDAVSNFNSEMEKIISERIESFKSDILSTAKEDYNQKKDEKIDWGDGYYTDEIKFSSVQGENYIGVAFDTYTNFGGPYPRTGFIAVMYDLENAKVFTYEDVTDDVAGLKKAIADDILIQIQEQELVDLMDDGYKEKVENLEDAQIYFSEDGAMVIFPQFVLSARLGTQTILVGYDIIDSFLNDYGRSMLFEYTGVMG